MPHVVIHELDPLRFYLTKDGKMLDDDFEGTTAMADAMKKAKRVAGYGGTVSVKHRGEDERVIWEPVPGEIIP